MVISRKDDGKRSHFERCSPKKKQSPPVSSSSQKSITLRSSDMLDRTICEEPMKKPIYQCKNGHPACSMCCIKLKKRCSFCELPIGDIRFRAIENVIEEILVPCPNVKYGCLKNTVYGDSSHEKLCEFSPCSCLLPKCDYIGSYVDLKRHIRSAHSSDGDIIEFIYDRPFTLPFSLNFRKGNIGIGFLQEENHGDLVVVRAFKSFNDVYVTMSCIKPMGLGIHNLSCSNQYTSVKIRSMVENIQNENGKMQSGGCFISIPFDMLSGDESDDLEMEICIGRENNYIHI